MSALKELDFPRSALYLTGVDNTPQTISTTGVYVKWLAVVSDATARDLIFQRPSGGAEYFRLRTSGTAAAIDYAGEFPFHFEDGVEVVSGAGSTIRVTVAFFGFGSNT